MQEPCSWQLSVHVFEKMPRKNKQIKHLSGIVIARKASMGRRRANERLQELLLARNADAQCHPQCEKFLFCEVFCSECTVQEEFHQEEINELFEDVVRPEEFVKIFESRWKGVGENWNRGGSSRSNYYRKDLLKRKLKSDAFKMRDISSFFGNSTNTEAEYDGMTLTEGIEKLNAVILSSTKCNRDMPHNAAWRVLQCMSVREYFSKISLGCLKMEASADIAKLIYQKESVWSYKARSIRRWGEYYLKNGNFPDFRQGKHQKNTPSICDEDIQHQLKSILRQMPDRERSPKHLMQKINDEGIVAPISERTAQRWLQILGFSCKKASKGWFTDNHEREDVVRDRDQFLEYMIPKISRMVTYSGPDCETVVRPVLANGEHKECVLITHDECTFYSNDGKRTFWMENGKHILLPKSRGASLMVSGFVCPCHGFMSKDYDGIIKKSYSFFYAGNHTHYKYVLHIQYI